MQHTRWRSRGFCFGRALADNAFSFCCISQNPAVDHDGGEYAELAAATSGRQRSGNAAAAGKASVTYAEIDHRIQCNLSVETANSVESEANSTAALL